MKSAATLLSQPAQEVLNQAPALTGYNLFLSDKTLTQAITRAGADWANRQLSELGQILGSEEAQRWGFEANENEPVLYTHDRYGNRRDEVVFHPSWHNLMRTSVEHGLHNLPWLEMKSSAKRKGAQMVRAALMMMTAQNEAGHTCPISMTFSSPISPVNGRRGCCRPFTIPDFFPCRKRKACSWAWA